MFIRNSFDSLKRDFRSTLFALTMHMEDPPDPDGGRGGKGGNGFSKEYVQDLREENKAYRLAAAEAKTRADALGAELATTKASLAAAETAKAEALKAQKTELETAHAAALQAEKDAAKAALAEKDGAIAKAAIDNAITAAATAAGVVDAEAFLKLVDTSKLVLKDGKLEGAEDLFKATKEAKPYLFGTPQKSTAHQGQPPKPGDPKPFDASTATPEELKAEKIRLGLK